MKFLRLLRNFFLFFVFFAFTIFIIKNYHETIYTYVLSKYNDSKNTSEFNKKLKAKYPVTEIKLFQIVINARNSENFVEKNLLSVFSQTHQNFHIIYIDDASADETFEKAIHFAKNQKMEDKITFIKKEERKSKLQNLYEIFTTFKDDEIIINLDGCDFLSHENVLKDLNAYYQNPDVWLTYSKEINYPSYEKIEGKCFKDYEIKNNKIRDNKVSISGLKSFYAGLFKLIPLKHLVYQGKFIPAMEDLALFLPMCEMASSHSLFIDDILYITNELLESKEDKSIQTLKNNIKLHLKNLSKLDPLDITFDPKIRSLYKNLNPPTLILVSKDNPKLLEQNLSFLTENHRELEDQHVIYRASSPSIEADYKELMKSFEKTLFHKESKYNLKEILEDNELNEEKSPYLLIIHEESNLRHKFDIEQIIDALETTKSKFLISSNAKPLNINIKIKDLGIYAVSKEEALRQPNLLAKNKFVALKKETLSDLNEIDLFKKSYVKLLLVNKKNIGEPTLIFSELD
jgi:glycosyltransferase involved in cell wall biosynthesis